MSHVFSHQIKATMFRTEAQAQPGRSLITVQAVQIVQIVPNVLTGLNDLNCLNRGPPLTRLRAID
jgi:hypothetical protein